VQVERRHRQQHLPPPLHALHLTCARPAQVRAAITDHFRNK
jgi:hypothetical protein